MDISYSDYQTLICTAADIYYDYLTNEFSHGQFSAGRSVISVLRVSRCSTPAEYLLLTDGRIKNPDESQIWVNGNFCPDLHITAVKKVGKHSDCIRVLDKSGTLDLFSDVPPDQIRIISDLRFLIQKLRAFYEQNSFSFSPAAPVSLPEIPSRYMDGLSREQLSAIATVFSSPVSYINGAPGTGKTAFVLSRCILRYILAGKRVFLLAPTNNAVEQVLRGILPILEQSGIDLRTVYRLGTASEEFAAEYPQVVGDTNKERLLQELQTRKEHYSVILNHAATLQAQCQHKSAVLSSCKAAHENICGCLPALAESFAAQAELKLALSSAEETYRMLSESYSQALQRETDAKINVDSCQDNIGLVRKKLNRTKLLFWKKSAKNALVEKQFQLLSLLPSYQQALSDAQIEVSHARLAQTDAHTRMMLCQNRCRDNKDRIRQLELEIGNFSQCYAPYADAVQALLANNRFEPETLIAVLDSLEAECRELSAELDSIPVDACQCEIRLIQQQLSRIGSSSKFQQKCQALVLAGTIDASLADLAVACNPVRNDDQDYSTYQPVYHVFLDEAGYTSLAKGMAAFAPHAPVTFLGDHNQLPPVCEMNRIPVEKFPVCLWALPVSYYSELLSGDFRHLFSCCYQQQDSPSFNRLAYAALNTSYRFGDALAKILGEHIYTPEFKGASDSPFEILYIDAPREHDHGKRVSLSECHVIENYLANVHPASCAVLAPYNFQVKQLRNRLRGCCEDVLTVHRSQGQEWDTIIFSVTDTSDMYFSDSRLPIGRHIINTAVSRARRRLILVCDCAYWGSCRNQLISAFLRAGRKMDATGAPVHTLPDTTGIPEYL